MDHNAAFQELTKRSGVILREHGFKGTGQNYKRDTGELWQGVNFQKTQWRTNADPVNFTLNLAVHYPPLERPQPFDGPLSFDKFTPSKADLTLRIGDFLPGGRDTWWDVEAPRLEEFWPQFAQIVTGAVIPAMNAMSTREGLADVCRTVPWMVSSATRQWLSRLAPPEWDPKEAKAGKWKTDERGRWWGPGEW